MEFFLNARYWEEYSSNHPDSNKTKVPKGSTTYQFGKMYFRSSRMPKRTFNAPASMRKAECHSRNVKPG
jgi:hypothetical protein